MSADLRAKLLALDDMEREQLHIPEWGQTVYVRVMTAAEREGLEVAVFEARSRKEALTYRAHVAVATVCDAEGVLLFTHADIPALAKKSGKALMRIVAASERLNALTEAAVEEKAKN